MSDSGSGSESTRRFRTTTRYVPVYLPLTAFVDWANAYCVEDETGCCADSSSSGSGSDGSDSGSGGGDPEPITTECCSESIPQTLFMTWSDGGQVMELTWDGTGWASGEVELTGCGMVSFRFRCDNPSFTFDNVVGFECSVVMVILSDSLTCDPFNFDAQIQVSGIGCCSTTYAIAIGPTAPAEPEHPGGGDPPPPPPPK